MATEESAAPVEVSEEAAEQVPAEVDKPSEEASQDAPAEPEAAADAVEEGEKPVAEVSEEAVENEAPQEEGAVPPGEESTTEAAQEAEPDQPESKEGEQVEGEVPETAAETAQAEDAGQDFADVLQPDLEEVPQNEEIPEKDEEPTINVAEPMSRGSSPAHSEGHAPPDMPDPASTPPPGPDDRYLEPEEQEQGLGEMPMRYEYEEELDSGDEEMMEPIYNRQDLVDKYHQLLEERSQLQSLNSQLQHKLAEYFKKKKTDERQQELEKNVADQEQRYLKYMANLEELQNESRSEQENYAVQIYELKERCQERQEKVNVATEDFMKFKFEIAKVALNSRSGRPIAVKDIEQYQLVERRKEMEVVQVRLENIRLKNRLKKREMQLKAKEELAEGLHLIDFEQLKIENQTYNEKIEERNEELQKLRKKITTTVQVLTHLKEKLQFVQAENAEQRNTLREVESRVAQRRDILTRTKQARDALRIDNVKLRGKSGLLGNEPLLRDFEMKKDQSDGLKSKIEQLKMQHIELTMNLTGVRHKIEQARQEVA